MKNIVEFANITYRYNGNEKYALQNFSMKLPLGKKCVILGRNGSGKSTVMLLTNGLVKPKDGAVFWKGQPVTFNKTGIQQLREKTGLLFQNADEMLLSPIVSEDLSYGLINAGYVGEKLHQKMDQILKQYQLVELRNHPIHHLSLGEKRRVALAGVMGLEPELLLLDEPTTYLDPAQVLNFIAELNRIHACGTTVVMATHDVELAYEWADWIFVIDNGQLIFQGAPDDLFQNDFIINQAGLTIPLLFQLKELLKDYSLDDNIRVRNEILSYLKDMLNKKEGTIHGG